MSKAPHVKARMAEPGKRRLVDGELLETVMDIAEQQFKEGTPFSYVIENAINNYLHETEQLEQKSLHRFQLAKARGDAFLEIILKLHGSEGQAMRQLDEEVPF